MFVNPVIQKKDILSGYTENLRRYVLLVDLASMRLKVRLLAFLPVTEHN